MRKPIPMADVMKLSVAERIQLVEDVWDSVANVPGEIELTPEERQLLDERLEAYHRDPAAASPWEDVVRRIRGGRMASRDHATTATA